MALTTTRSLCRFKVVFEIYISLALLLPVFHGLCFSPLFLSPPLFCNTHTLTLFCLCSFSKESRIWNIISSKSVGSRLFPEGFSKWSQLYSRLNHKNQWNLQGEKENLPFYISFACFPHLFSGPFSEYDPPPMAVSQSILPIMTNLNGFDNPLVLWIK